MIALPKLLALSALGGSIWAAVLVPTTQTSLQQPIPAAYTLPDTEKTRAAAPRANPDASGKYHVGDGVTAPKLIHSVKPKYPKELGKKKVSGICLIGLIVDADGAPADVHVKRSIADGLSESLRADALTLDDNAVAAVQQYRFEPAEYEGKPVPLEMNVQVQFRIY